MRHSELLVSAVENVLEGDGGSDGRMLAIVILDALRAAEAEEMKTYRQALVDTIDDVGSTAGANIADAILADFHVALREEETVPLRGL